MKELSTPKLPHRMAAFTIYTVPPSVGKLLQTQDENLNTLTETWQYYYVIFTPVPSETFVFSLCPVHSCLYHKYLIKTHLKTMYVSPTIPNSRQNSKNSSGWEINQ